MNRGEEILEQILNASHRAIVLTGPANCGKSAAVVAMYRRFSLPGQKPACLLILPNSQAVSAVRRQLLELSRGNTLLDPQIMTFASLSRRILSGCRVKTQMISPLRRHLLLRQILDGLAGEGKLQALAPVAHTPGAVLAIDRSLAELKRAAVEPEAFAKVLDPVASAPGKLLDLLEVYRRYQNYLQEHALYDLEGQLWRTRDELDALSSDTLPPGLEHARAIAVDGFADFTPTQLAILRKLSHVGPLAITLPLGSDSRQRLWHWTQRTLGQIEAAFEGTIERISVEGHEHQSAVAGLASKIFNYDSPPQQPPAAISVIAAAGPEAELAAVARKVKRLLADGAKPGDIAVLARSLEPYRQALGRVFAEHCIPLAPVDETLTDNPLVRFILAVANIAPLFEFNTVLPVIRSSYFQPSALGDFDASTVSSAELLIRQGNVLGGKDAYRQAAERLKPRYQRINDEREDTANGPGPRDATPAALEQACQMLDRLFELVEQTHAGDLTTIVDKLQLLGACLDMAKHAPPAWWPIAVSRDLRALAAFKEALSELSFDDQPKQAGTEVRRLYEALASVKVPPSKTPGLVQVMDVLDARSLSYDHVLLLGLNENTFPQRLSESSFISETQRRAWSGRIALDCRRDLTAREMLLFYMAVTRARKTLTLCYQSSDTAGRPSAESNFLSWLLEPCGGLAALSKCGQMTSIPTGQLMPGLDEVATDGDAFSAAVRTVFEHSPAPWPIAGKAVWLDQQRLTATCRGLLSRYRRWRTAPCDNFDGRLSDVSIIAELTSNFPDKHTFSASQLGSFGLCPWQFFANYVLHLQPLAQPERVLEAVDVGTFCHNVLFRLMTDLRRKSSSPLRLNAVEPETLEHALEQAIAAERASVESRRPPYPALWQVQLDQMRKSLRAYLAFIRKNGIGEQAHFELSFGISNNFDELQDPFSQPEPLQISTPGGTILLRGKIDRVDRVTFEDLEGLLVVDYKTGRLPSERDLTEGRNLQLQLYAAAAEALLKVPALGGAFHHVSQQPAMRYVGAIKNRGLSISQNDNHKQMSAATFDLIGRFVESMRQGRFDLQPTKRCPSWCAYRQICNFSQARAPMKAPPVASTQDDQEEVE